MYDAVAATSQRRSVVFVSGLKLEGLAACIASEADAVCIDIEDAVPPQRKHEARSAVLEALATIGPADGAKLMVRINSLRTLDGVADIQAFLTQTLPLSALVMPKVESADEVRWAAALADHALSDLRLVGIIETTAGLEHCLAIASASPRLAALFFGGFDLSTALGAEMAWEPLLYARSRVVHAAAAADLQVLDSPHLDLDDEAGLRIAAAQARALGMTGKTAKDARQVAIINTAFSPSATELAYAARVVAAYAADPAATLLIDGKLVELPTIKRLRRIASMGSVT